MPLQNRVTPFGDIVALPERGLMLGNRGGRFHDPKARRLGSRRFASRRWICCELAFKNRKHEVFGERYTALFFLDEATALAAGHRPCFECRYADAVAFREAFARGNNLASPPRADEMDLVLHVERRSERPPIADWRDLPDGAMVASGADACLVLDGRLLAWSMAGYRPPAEGSAGQKLRLLTPPSIVNALAAGFKPRLHPTAFAVGREAAS
jgi:hypothetical protein